MMEKANILDFFTRKSYEEITTSNFEQNDQLTEKYGVYLGCLNKIHTHNLRTLVSQMEFISEQINKLTLDCDELHSEHQKLLKYCLSTLGKANSKVNNVNLSDDTIMISEDGHVWVINSCLKKD